MDELNGYRMLVIDDNPAIHEDFRKILNPSNAEIEEKLTEIYATLFSAAETNQNHTPSLMPNFIIDSAYQGMEGLELVNKAVRENNPYAVLFVDIRMPPGWDGIETIKHIWEKDEAIQTVICTAYSDYSWTDIINYLGQSDRLLILKKPLR